jgi:hypothetical protein
MISAIRKAWNRRTLLCGSAISLSIFLAYYGLWNAYFFSDDFWMLGWVRHQPGLGDAIWAEFGYGVRFLLDAVNWTRVKLFDLDPSPYYWISILQHTLVTFIVYGLVRLWTHRHLLAFPTALLFGTTFAHFEVITWITGSEYSLGAILYFSALAFFTLYLRHRRWPAYVASLTAFILLLLFLEMSLSLPLVLLATHLFVGFRHRTWRSIGWHDIRLHVLFWALFVIYLALQFSFVHTGSSEATVATAVYSPGPHMITNLLYFAYLIVPPYGPGVLSIFLDPLLIEAGLVAIAVAVNVAAAYAFWKGSALVRFALALMYLPFLPYTLWQGGYAGAIRYRYLSALGFSLLLVLLGIWCHERLRHSSRPGLRRMILALALVMPAINIGLDQVWVQRHVENSAFRRAFVTDLHTAYSQVEAGTHIYIEIPAAKYDDLEDACTLVFKQAVLCETFIFGDRRIEEMIERQLAPSVYWLRATNEGIQQIYPPPR